MSLKEYGLVKSSCYSKTTTTSVHKHPIALKCKPKKVISSRKLPCNDHENKSCSVVNTKKSPARAQKTTQSDVTVFKNHQHMNVLDYCKKCGDEFHEKQSKEQINKMVTAMNIKSVRNDNKMRINKKPSKSVQQYYKNENFRLSTESVQLNGAIGRKERLDPIKEVSELHSSSQDSVFVIYSDSEDDNINIDLDNDSNIKKLKQFRRENYFECHSTKSRIKNKPSVTSLNNHKCVYRFYLNDRLFPVPLNTDYNNKIRCVECHLPMDIKQESKDDKINGTIQAKVKLGKETKDMLLLLPIKESLIIKERRKEERKENDNYVYFGVVKLTTDGNSVFNKNLPQDSLALKYQKGYKGFKFYERYAYKNIRDNDIIVI